MYMIYMHLFINSDMIYIDIYYNNKYIYLFYIFTDIYYVILYLAKTKIPMTLQFEYLRQIDKWHIIIIADPSQLVTFFELSWGSLKPVVAEYGMW